MTQSQGQTQAPEKPAPGTQLGDPNDQRDGAWVETEWKPRPRLRTIGGIEWLARMSDKARAHAKGTIGDYISIVSSRFHRDRTPLASIGPTFCSRGTI